MVPKVRRYTPSRVLKENYQLVFVFNFILSLCMNRLYKVHNRIVHIFKLQLRVYILEVLFLLMEWHLSMAIVFNDSLVLQREKKWMIDPW